MSKLSSKSIANRFTPPSPTTFTTPCILAPPETSSRTVGAFVPIPTLPLGRIVIFSLNTPALTLSKTNRPLLSAPLRKARIVAIVLSTFALSLIWKAIFGPKPSAISSELVLFNERMLPLVFISVVVLSKVFKLALIVCSCGIKTIALVFLSNLNSLTLALPKTIWLDLSVNEPLPRAVELVAVANCEALKPAI